MDGKLFGVMPKVSGSNGMSWRNPPHFEMILSRARGFGVVVEPPVPVRLGDLGDRLHPVEDVLPELGKAVGLRVVARHADDRHVARLGVRLLDEGRLRNQLPPNVGAPCHRRPRGAPRS